MRVTALSSHLGGMDHRHDGERRCVPIGAPPLLTTSGGLPGLVGGVRQDVAVSSTALIATRLLGARGSRRDVAADDPAGVLTEATQAVLAAVPEWWTARAAEVGLDGEWLDVFYAVDAAAPAAAVNPVVEPRQELAHVAGEELGHAYVQSLPQGVRARHGRHYTPDDMSAHLWALTRRALDLPPQMTRLTFLVRDRACGGGALLIPPLREHVQASVRTHAAVALAGLEETVAGVELDPNAAWLASVVLAAEALPLVAAVSTRWRKPLPALVTCGDGLVTGERPARVELQNPPYGRVKLGDEERRRWSHVLYGHANLYGLFMAAAVEDLTDDGVLAALVPTSFTAGRYFENLRGMLSTEVRLRDAAFVEERGAFESVLQETCLVTFTRRKSRYVSISSLNGRLSPVARVESPTTKLPWLLPRRLDDAPVAAGAARLPLRLRDIGYRCSTGPLVWNRRVSDLRARAAAGTAPIVWGADIDGGQLHRDPARSKHRYIRLNGNDLAVLVQEEPAILAQRTTAPEQARRLVVAPLTREDLERWGGRVVVENHVNVIRPADGEPAIDQATLAAALATTTMDRVMRSLSGSVAVSAYEIEAIPLPALDVMRTWVSLDGEELERAVADAYRPAF